MAIVDENEDLNLEEDTLIKLLENIGIKVKDDVERCQISKRGKSARISVLCRSGVCLDSFCKENSIAVSKWVACKGIHKEFWRKVGE